MQGMRLALGSIVLVGSLVLGAPASALRLDFRPDHGELSSIAWMAEGRIGGSRTHELALLGRGDRRARGMAEFPWRNGTPIPFSISFDASAGIHGRVVFTMGVGGVREKRLALEPSRAFDDLLLRVHAVGRRDRLALTGLELDGHAFPDQLVSGGTAWLDLPGAESDQSFLLSGVVTMSWQRSRPRDGSLAFQVKALEAPDPPAVPEPTPLAFALLASGVELGRRVAAGARRRMRAIVRPQLSRKR
jgi:hypothetical protein